MTPYGLPGIGPPLGRPQLRTPPTNSVPGKGSGLVIAVSVRPTHLRALLEPSGDGWPTTAPAMAPRALPGASVASLACEGPGHLTSLVLMLGAVTVPLGDPRPLAPALGSSAIWQSHVESPVFVVPARKKSRGPGLRRGCSPAGRDAGGALCLPSLQLAERAAEATKSVAVKRKKRKKKREMATCGSNRLQSTHGKKWAKPLALGQLPGSGRRGPSDCGQIADRQVLGWGSRSGVDLTR